MTGAHRKIAVFIDWQNTYKTAREAFGWSDYPNEYGNYSPYSLARILAAGNARGNEAALVRVNIHRGLPSQKHDRAGYAANRRQSAAWIAESPEVVVPRLRPLRYSRDPNEPPHEKGIDVERLLARHGSRTRDRASGASEGLRVRRDRVMVVRDVQPPPENQPPVFHHSISEAVFRRLETRVNYAHGR